QERGEPGLIVRIARGCWQEDTDMPHLLTLLPPRPERLCHRTTNKGSKLPPVHSMPHCRRRRREQNIRLQRLLHNHAWGQCCVHTRGEGPTVKVDQIRPPPGGSWFG